MAKRFFVFSVVYFLLDKLEEVYYITDWSVNDRIVSQEAYVKNIKTKRRNEILNAALKIFPLMGYDATAVDSIAQEVGLSKGTLYLYFKNKKELYISMIEREFKNILSILERILCEKKGVVERLMDLVHAELSYIEKQRGFYQLSSVERGGASFKRIPGLKKRIYPIYEKMFNKIVKLIEEGIKSGELRKVDKRIATISLLGMLHSTAISWLVEKEKYSLKKKSEEIVNIFLDGIRR